MHRAVDVSAGGTFLSETGTASQKKKLAGVNLCPAAAVATLKVQQTDVSGLVLYQLQAAANGAAVNCPIPVAFEGKIFVTISGSGAQATVYEY